MADVPIETRRNLYEGGVQDVLETIQGVDSAARAVLLVGHQPTWGEVVRRLAGDARIRVPTGTGVRIDVDIDAWSTTAFGDGVVEWVLPPRLLR
jgi:phosphohistidine phosphatase SixA